MRHPPFLAPRLRRSALLACVLLAGALPLAAQQASIAGRITARGTNEPLGDSRVILVGTSLYTNTNSEGRYTLRNVPAGTHTARIIRVGYSEQKRTLTVAAGQAVTLDVVLEPAVIKLTEIVTTATGEQRKIELGNSVANIDLAKVMETAPVSNLQDALSSRTPGVNISSSSQVGGGSRVRIRGNSSLNLSNDPIYVIDGIRLTSNSNSSSLFTGGAAPSRANDINPDDIESVEIVKGPSAATLYGTDAANGVIVITTRTGRAGAPKLSLLTEAGLITDRSSYPYNYSLAGHSPTNPATLYVAGTGECYLPKVSAGLCVPDSLRMYSPLNDPSATVIGTGYRNKLGSTASGGTEAIRYFISGEREEEVGTIKLPDFEQQRYDSLGIEPADYTKRPNNQHKHSFRGNINASPTSTLDLALNSNYLHVNTLYATESNATAGIGSQIFGGKGFQENGVVTGLGTGVASTPLHGYRAWTPGYTFEELNQQRVNRAVTSGSANWRPTSWMQNRATIGLDYTSRVDLNQNLRGQGPPVNSTYRQGFKDDYRTGLRNFTADLGTSGVFNPREWLGSRTTLGAQYTSYQFDQSEAFARNLPPGAVTPNSGVTKDARETTNMSKTLGYFVEQQFTVRDRLFLTGAVRTDQNSAFGTAFQRVYYPKAALSYVVSDESFFPKQNWLDQLRLRAAYGASGVQPGPTDAIASYGGVSSNLRQADATGVVYTALGNPELKPERTTEFEGGADLRMFDQRLNVELTYYSKLTRDALIDAIVPPSAGAAQFVKRNLGSVKNAGFEALVTSQFIDRPAFGFNLTVTGSLNDNKLVSLGGVPPIIGTISRAVEGYPLFGLWERPITGWDDKNHDGILTYNADPNLNEVFVGDSAIYRGYSLPRYTATVTPEVTLLNRHLRLTSLIDYKGGNRYYNNTERIRCVSRGNCNGLNNPEASFEEQAMVVATLDNPYKTLDGFLQPGSFVRWRELSATILPSEAFAARFFRSKSVSLNIAARNIGIRTNYRGIDPEIDRLSGASSNSPPEEFQTLGIPSYYTFRLNLGF
jgi:TonB-linked SusC/RagA family outer membrane protein